MFHGNGNLFSGTEKNVIEHFLFQWKMRLGMDFNLLYKFNSDESAYGYVFALENLFELKKNMEKIWKKYINANINKIDV